MGREEKYINKALHQQEKYQTVMITMWRSERRCRRLVALSHEGGESGRELTIKLDECCWKGEMVGGSQESIQSHRKGCTDPRRRALTKKRLVNKGTQSGCKSPRVQ